MTRLRGPEAYQIALLRSWGEEARAQRLLDSLNAFNVAFGGEPFEMPAPLSDLPDLVTAPADRTTAQVERELRFTIDMQKPRRAA